MKEKVIVVPGSVELAMLTSMIDAYGWLSMQIKRVESKIWEIYGLSRESKSILLAPPSIKIESMDTLEPLKSDFTRTRFFRLRVDILQDPDLEELIIYEFEVAIYRRIYGLLTALTDREIEVLKKRIDERKSVAETAKEMNITPQGVVSFLRSIRGKVQQHLWANFTTRE